jgi:hypothetical protein
LRIRILGFNRCDRRTSDSRFDCVAQRAVHGEASSLSSLKVNVPADRFLQSCLQLLEIAINRSLQIGDCPH